MKITVPFERQKEIIEKQKYSLNYYQDTLNSNILIQGLNPVGIEIARNLVLMGFSGLFLRDKGVVDYLDLSSPFYDEQDLQMKKTIVAKKKLESLKTICNIQIIEDEFINVKNLSEYKIDTVVICDELAINLIDLNMNCRNMNINFISIEAYGLAGSIFVDCGDEHVVVDPNGQTPAIYPISDITIDGNITITYDHCGDDEADQLLQDGDVVYFENLFGMPELNNKKFVINNTAKDEFELEKPNKEISEYTYGGHFYKIKKKETVSFNSLKHKLSKNEVAWDQIYFFQVLKSFWEFKQSKNRLPKSYNVQDALELIDICKSLNSDVDEEMVRLFSFTCRGSLPPVNSYLASCASNEILKGFTGIGYPIDGFYCYHSFECLPERLPKDFHPIGSEFDGQIIVFGKEFQDELSRKSFLIPTLGLKSMEFLKTISSMGIATTENSKCIITNIQENNKYLESIKDLNLKVHPIFKNLEEKGNTFSDEFWNEIDFTLQGFEQRKKNRVVPDFSLSYRVPMVDADVLGGSGIVSNYIPSLTNSKQPDAPEIVLPLDTILSFPSNIKSTMLQAEHIKELLFDLDVQDTNQLIKMKTEFFDNKYHFTYRHLSRLMINIINRPVDFEDCVLWARKHFYIRFVEFVDHLSNNFPPDRKESSGRSFYRGSRVPPKHIEFDENDPLHMKFIISASNLRALLFDIQGFEDENLFDFKSVLKKFKIPKMDVNDTVTISDENMKTIIEEQFKKLEDKNLSSLTPINWEEKKGLSTSYVFAYANLKALSYGIPKASESQVKKFVHKIRSATLPMISAVTSLGCIELYKIIQKLSKDQLRDSYINFSQPMAFQNEPAELKISSDSGIRDFSIWDRIELDFGKNILLTEMVDYLEKEFNIGIECVANQQNLLFWSRNFKKSKNLVTQRLNTGEDLSDGKTYYRFTVMGVNDNDEDVELPEIRYKCRNFPPKAISKHFDISFNFQWYGELKEIYSKK
eukprot:gene5465-9283_t